MPGSASGPQNGQVATPGTVLLADSINRWAKALNAFDVTFDACMSAGRN